MEPKPTLPSNRSWEEIIARASSEAPPEIDVRSAIRRQIVAGLSQAPAEVTYPTVLDVIAALFPGFRGLAVASTALLVFSLLGWQTIPVVRDVVIVLQIHNAFLANI
jgi:hypothetical protein